MDGLKGLFSATLSWLRRVSLPVWSFPLTALLVLAGLAWRRPESLAALWRKPPPGDPQSLLLAKVERRLARRGLTRWPHETVSEFAQRVSAELSAETGAAYRAWLDEYVAMRFGGHPQALSVEGLP